MSRESIQYWDASVFCAIISAETGRVEVCKALYNDAIEGKIHIVTSTVTIAECSGGDQFSKLSEDDLDARNNEIMRLFLQRCVTLVEPDPLLSQYAQRLQQWTRREKGHKVRPIDALHVASAIRGSADMLLSYDAEHLIRMHNYVFPQLHEPLPIKIPERVSNLSLFDVNEFNS